MSAETELRDIVGEAYLRDGTATDRLDGIEPRWVVRPGSADETSAILRLADRTGWRIAPRGGGTKLGIGNPPRELDLILDLSRLDRVIEHATGDLVVVLEAGTPIRELQRQLGAAGQMLALDVADHGATVGGIIATNAAGPRRLRYGTVRDLLIGVTIVLADGTVAKAGGKVVKNVAGYDLSKLMTGSLGTLGVIVEAVFRLHPRPPARRLLEFELAGSDGVKSAVQRLLHSSVVPSALQLRWDAGTAPRLGVLLEGVEPSVISQSEATEQLLGLSAVVETDSTDGRWSAFLAEPVLPEPVRVKVTCLPAELDEVIDLVRRAGRRVGDLHLGGSVGNGILEVHVAGSDPPAVAEMIGEVRSGLKQGHATVVQAPVEVKRHVDVWGPVGDSLPLMRRVKQRFDPAAMLNPGRFVGGI